MIGFAEDGDHGGVDGAVVAVVAREPLFRLVEETERCDGALLLL